MNIRDWVTEATWSDITSRSVTKPSWVNMDTAYVYAWIYYSGSGSATIYMDLKAGNTTIKTFWPWYLSSTFYFSMWWDFTLTTATSYTLVLRWSNYVQFHQKPLFVFQRTVDATVVKAKMDTINRKANFLWVANNSALTWETVQVTLNWTAEIQWVQKWLYYRLSTTTEWKLQENNDWYNIVGMWIEENKFAIQKWFTKIMTTTMLSNEQWTVDYIVHRMNRKASKAFIHKTRFDGQDNIWYMNCVEMLYSWYDCVILPSSWYYSLFFE